MNAPLSCIVIDDEELARENMLLLLQEYCPEMDVIANVGSESKIIKALMTLNPDLVFMDVQIGSITIFDILKKLDQIDFEIIFVSAYNEYAVEGYFFDAIGYLLKPVDPKLLQEMVQKVIDKKMANKKLNSLNTEFKKTIPSMYEVPKISIADNKETHVIKVMDLLYAISNGNYTTLVRNKDEDIVICRNLKYIESLLSPYGFFRIHRSYLVNLNEIKTIVKDQGGYLVMSDNKELSISRDNKKDLYHKLNIV